MRSEEKILETLEEAEGYLSQREISRRCDISRPTVKKKLESLEQKNLIEIEEVGNTHLHRRSIADV